MKQVLAAVGYAHSKCVVHRDLKPANILVTASGDVKVTDFGIAKVIGDSNLTRTGTSMGSPAYMSPEQVLGKKDIDHSADIYSLGATLFEMLTGRPPFVISDGGVSDSDFSIKTAHVQQEPPAIQELVPGVPVSVAEAVMKALKKNPDDRHASCAEFLEHLALCSANAPGCANGIAPRRKKLFAGVGLAVLGIVLNIVVYAKISDFAVATRRAVELEAKKNSEEAEARRKADAFNAYQLWEGSVQTLVTQYPEDYDRKDGEITPDGVFYVKWRDFWDGVRFFGTPTLDAKVDGALLIYPVKNGRQLKIRFSDLSKNEMKHDSAVQYCKDQGLRLPTIRELFDYCAAGTEKNSEGRFENHRCGNKETWSASVYSGLRSFAWRFLGNYGFVNGSGRYNSLGVRCVGGE